MLHGWAWPSDWKGLSFIPAWQSFSRMSPNRCCCSKCTAWSCCLMAAEHRRLFWITCEFFFFFCHLREQSCRCRVFWRKKNPTTWNCFLRPIFLASGQLLHLCYQVTGSWYPCSVSSKSNETSHKTLLPRTTTLFHLNLSNTYCIQFYWGIVFVNVSISDENNDPLWWWPCPSLLKMKERMGNSDIHWCFGNMTCMRKS